MIIYTIACYIAFLVHPQPSVWGIKGSGLLNFAHCSKNWHTEDTWKGIRLVLFPVFEFCTIILPTYKKSTMRHLKKWKLKLCLILHLTNFSKGLKIRICNTPGNQLFYDFLSILRLQTPVYLNSTFNYKDLGRRFMKILTVFEVLPLNLIIKKQK